MAPRADLTVRNARHYNAELKKLRARVRALEAELRDTLAWVVRLHKAVVAVQRRQKKR